MISDKTLPVILSHEYRQRWEKTQAMMEREGFDLLVAYADDRAEFGPAYVRWLANFPAHFEPVCTTDAITRRTVEFTINKQFLLYSYNFTDLGRFQFIARAAFGEGQVGGRLRRIPVERFDRDQYLIEWWGTTSEEMIRDIQNTVKQYRENKYAFRVGLKDLGFDVNKDLLKALGMNIPFQSINQAEQALCNGAIKP